MRAVKILLFSTLFPNSEQARHGIFVENRLRHLLADCPVSAQVVAPVPWFFSSAPVFGAYAAYTRVPRSEERHGVTILHPRYLVVPGLSWHVAPRLLYHGARETVRRLRQEGYDFDLIDAHYYYPDGVAAVMLGRELGVPVVITARGNDLSLLPSFRRPRQSIQWAEARAAASITVCSALADALVALGGRPERVTVLRNGVDLEVFRPVDRDAARAEFGLTGDVLLSVGHLIERKGNHVTIEALRELPDTTLLLVGDGPEQGALRALARRCGVSDRVRFLGARPQGQLAALYAAADALVLASSREGWANVLLEAMACGTPVVATAIWGTPEVVAAPEAGVLVESRTPSAIADGVRKLLAARPERGATRAYAERFDWRSTSIGQYELFCRVLDAQSAASTVTAGASGAYSAGRK